MRLPPPITSRTNARVKALRDALRGDARRPGDLLGLEGEHLIQEAHGAGFSFEAVYLRQGSEETLQRHPFYGELRTNDWIVLSAAIFDSVVSTVTPQGIAATWSITQPVPRQGSYPVTLLIENLQDPGNLGTLIRTMAGFGMAGIVVTPQTVNCWNPKVVRASAGAVFRIPVQRRPLAEAVADLRAQHVRIFAAVADFAHGDEYGGSARLMAKNGVLTGRTPNAEPAAVGRRDRVAASPSGGLTYPASFSYDTDFELPCAILIGNEGAGLSREARVLADEQVTIPGVNESMNAAIAGAILLYEVMRQEPLRAWARQQGLRA